ncbi:MAG: hydrogen peroxide-inducible genes activator [Hyphomicrobiales bacterium]|nr:hydrogen peroxide-inducible genes activator [Hyphomicrobiales bacterium]
MGYLVALYEHQHFGRAAEACNVTQSTLSAGLKELEAVLGMNLVERTRRVVVFTPAGVGVVRRAQDLLLRAREIALLDAASLSGVLRLSVIPTIAPFLLSPILTGIRHIHPGLQLQVHEEFSQDGCAGLASGNRDCVVLALPYECGDFEYATLFDDPILVALSADDPLAQAERINPSDLPYDRLVLLQDGHCLRDHALKACGRPGYRPKAPGAASIHTLIQLVDAGLGVALAPQLAIERGVTAGTNVVVRPLGGQEMRRVVAMAWRRQSPRADGFAQLALTIRQICVEAGLAKST